MRTYTKDQAPDAMFTRAQLRRMGLKPVPSHSAYVTIPPQRRRYKLYTLDHARPMNPAAGYSLLVADNSEEAKQRFEAIRQRFVGRDQ